MSLFGGLLGDFDDDPFFGGHVRRMNNMMNSMMGDLFGPPFSGMLGPVPPRSDIVPYGNYHARNRRAPQDYMPPMQNQLMPMGFGFPNLRSMFQDVGNGGNCHSYSSSTVMTMTSGPDGRPQVYQASSSMRQAPGGIKETKKTVADSRTGFKKMSVGHHIGERAHIVEREQNYYDGSAEEHQEYINLDEEEADDFNSEWQRKVRPGNAIGYHSSGPSRHHNSHRGRSSQLALPSSSPSANNTGDKEARSDSSSSTGKKRKQEEDEDSGDEHERDSRDERPQPKRQSKEPPLVDLSQSD